MSELGDVIESEISTISGLLSGVFYAGSSAKKPFDVMYFTIKGKSYLSIKLTYPNNDKITARRIREHIGEKAYQVIYGPREDKPTSTIDNVSDSRTIYDSKGNKLCDVRQKKVEPYKKLILGPRGNIISSVYPQYDEPNFLCCVGSQIKVEVNKGKKNYSQFLALASSIETDERAVLFDNNKKPTVIYKK